MNDIFEMAVQDIFNISGVGTVFTGKSLGERLPSVTRWFVAHKRPRFPCG